MPACHRLSKRTSSFWISSIEHLVAVRFCICRKVWSGTIQRACQKTKTLPRMRAGTKKSKLSLKIKIPKGIHCRAFLQWCIPEWIEMFFYTFLGRFLSDFSIRNYCVSHLFVSNEIPKSDSNRKCCFYHVTQQCPKLTEISSKTSLCVTRHTFQISFLRPTVWWIFGLKTVFSKLSSRLRGKITV